jgi:hypothetical protein
MREQIPCQSTLPLSRLSYPATRGAGDTETRKTRSGDSRPRSPIAQAASQPSKRSISGAMVSGVTCGSKR